MLPEDLFIDRAPAVLTVSQINQNVKHLLESQIQPLAVAGEISNLKIVSGHAYFVLKDAAAQLPAVMFRIRSLQPTLELRDGQAVTARGRLTLYVPNGRYQLVVQNVTRAGIGSLQAAIAELKDRLKNEGLFDQGRKRVLPLVPKGVAVVTSPTGAVVRDIVQIATRRFPLANILVVPARVQGTEARASIVAAIARANTESTRLGLDVLIVARGGGSIEDLWAFNDEEVARAVFASDLPVISAVGHETDFTIVDFVADVRAPTPSAAAEIVFPVAADLKTKLDDAVFHLHRILSRELQSARHQLRAVRADLGDIRRLLEDRIQLLGSVEMRLKQRHANQMRDARHALTTLTLRLRHLHPRGRVNSWQAQLDQLRARITARLHQKLEVSRARLLGLDEKIRALSPQAVLERGYSITFDVNGRLVRRTHEIAPGDNLTVRLAHGRLAAVVKRVEPE